MSTDDNDGDDNESKRLLSGFEKLPAFKEHLENLLAADFTKEPTPQEKEKEWRTWLRLRLIVRMRIKINR